LRMEEFGERGCICEADLDISLIWRNMRSGFGYKLLYAMLLGSLKGGIKDVKI